MYAMALTALTVISVMADLLSINDAVHTSGVSVVVKMGVLQLLVIFLIYLYFEPSTGERDERRPSMHQNEPFEEGIRQKIIIFDFFNDTVFNEAFDGALQGSGSR